MSKASGVRLLTRYPAVVIGLFTVLLLAAAWFARYFEIDASADTLLVKDNQLYMEAREMAQRFSPEEFVLVVYRPHDGNIFSSTTRSNIASMSERFLQMDRVASVTSILNVPLLPQLDEVDSDLQPEQWTWQQRDFSQAELTDLFTDHPIYTGQLVNSALNATSLQVVFEPHAELAALNREVHELEGQALEQEPAEADRARLETLNAQVDGLQETLDAARMQEIDLLYGIAGDYRQDAEIFLGGNYVLVKHLIDIIQNDLVVFGSAIGLIICLLLFLLFRDIRWVLVPLLCCLGSVLITMGLFGLLGFKTTVISSNFVALQLILTLALVIHLMVQYQELARQDAAASHHALVEKTLMTKVKPVFYAGLTTCVGFASLLFSNIQPVISFGWMMIVAMFTTLAVSLLLFPSLMALSSRVLAHRPHRVSRHIMSFFLRRVRANPAAIIVGSILLALFSIAGMRYLDVENSFIHYFRDSTQVRKELSFIDQEMGGTTPLDVIYQPPPAAGNPDLVVTAQQLQTLQKIQYSLASSAAVGKLMSVVNFAEMAKQINGGAPLTEYELNSVYLMLDQELRERLLGSYLDPQTGQFRISARIQDTTEQLDRAEFLHALRETLAALGVEREQYSLTNLFVLYQDILQRLFASQVLTIGIVYLALGLVLLMIFRSPLVAAIALAPNVLATLFILGMMGWWRIPLDLMTITIAAITMGIAVDDTIHFVHRYLQEVERDVETALERTFHGVGYALLFTTLIIALGFSILGFSDFIPSVLFGLLTCLAMAAAFLIDMTLLPVLLRWYSGRRGSKLSDLPV